MLTTEQFIMNVLDAYHSDVPSKEVVEVMLDRFNITCTIEQVEQLYAYFEIAFNKPTIH